MARIAVDGLVMKIFRGMGSCSICRCGQFFKFSSRFANGCTRAFNCSGAASVCAPNCVPTVSKR